MIAIERGLLWLPLIYYVYGSTRDYLERNFEIIYLELARVNQGFAGDVFVKQKL